jgi:hypothetical protein
MHLLTPGTRRTQRGPSIGQSRPPCKIYPTRCRISRAHMASRNQSFLGSHEALGFCALTEPAGRKCRASSSTRCVPLPFTYYTCAAVRSLLICNTHISSVLFLHYGASYSWPFWRLSCAESYSMLQSPFFDVKVLF